MARKKISNELKTILETIPEDRKAIAGRLIDELIFMQETLTDLKDRVKTDGVIDDFKQGKQEFKRESPALKSYNATLKQYSALYKQLTDLLPRSDTASSNPVYEFLKDS